MIGAELTHWFNCPLDKHKKYGTFMMKKLLAAMALFTLVGMSAVQAGDVTFLTAQDPGDWAAHRLVGTKVLNANGEKIGDINDVVVDVNGRVSVIVIGVGGVLGFNEKSVGVPFYQVQVGDVLGGSRIVVINTTADELKAAPPYSIKDPTKTDRLKKLAKDWGSKAKVRAMELSKKAAEKAREMKEMAEDKAMEMKDKANEALNKKQTE